MGLFDKLENFLIDIVDDIKYVRDNIKEIGRNAQNEASRKLTEISVDIHYNIQEKKRNKNIQFPPNYTSRNIAPGAGSVVYCIFSGTGGMEGHSGIYLGMNQIAELNGKGEIKSVSLEEFTSSLATLDYKLIIPVNKDTKQPVFLFSAASCATSKIGDSRNYNLIMDNCHQFCAGCISGNFENAINHLGWLKEEFEKEISEPISWVEWDWKKQ